MVRQAARAGRLAASASKVRRRLAGEELVAVDEPEQRHRLVLQRVDDMPVVDDMTMPAMGMSSTSSQRHLRRTAQRDLEAIVVEVDTQPVANEARGHAIEDLAQDEATRGGHGDDGLLVVGGAPARQLLQCRLFEVDPWPEPRIPAADDLINEPAIGGRSSKSRERCRRRASSSTRSRCPCALSIEPFSCATLASLRLGVIRE